MNCFISIIIIIIIFAISTTSQFYLAQIEYWNTFD